MTKESVADNGEENTMLTNMMYVTLYVADQDNALKFYTEAIGLEKRTDNLTPDGKLRFLTVGVPGSPVGILLWPGDPASGKPIEAEKGESAGRVWLESDDLRKDFEVFRDRGVKFLAPEPEDYVYGARIEAVDPDGNRISFRQIAEHFRT